ncbi:MAG: UTP--glucose-1-phosphate uridylyltransferase [Bacilli bacterium]|nr:UTP--glucose-1-phosphate uridylyltransferase [Bacilli bacterium]
MQKIRKAIIPIGGFGTRFLPITKSIPKEMLPIVDKPTIHYIVDEVLKSGIEEILIVTNTYRKVTEDYFDSHYELEHFLEEKGKDKALKLVRDSNLSSKIYYVRQDKPLGSAYAISLAKKFVNNEPFAIIYGDDLIKSGTPTLKQLIDVYEKYDANVIGVQEVADCLVSRYGIIEYINKDTGQMKGIIEKPTLDQKPSNSAALGRYIVKPEIFDEIDKLSLVNGEYLFTEAMTMLMKKQPFYTCKIDGRYYDTGNKLGYLQANIEYALDHDEVKEDFKKYLIDLNMNIDK